MTTGWLIVNIALAVIVTTLVAGLAVLVPLRLARGGATTPGPGAVPASDRTHELMSGPRLSMARHHYALHHSSGR